MKALSEFSVNYPVTIMMMVLATLLLGYISFSELGIDLLPDLNNPQLFIELTSGERPPEEIENLFIESIEAIAIRQKGVVQVNSVLKTGAARISVEYNWDTDMDEAFLDLQKNLSNFSQNTEIDEISLSQHNPNTAPVLIFALSRPEIDDMDELRKIAVNYLSNELTRLEGIAAVEILGAEEKEIVVSTTPYLLKAHGLTPSQVTEKIQSSNRTISGGSIEESGLKYVIKGLGEFQSIEDIGNVIVARKQQEKIVLDETVETVPIYLRDIARITYRNKDPENIVRVNRKRCIALAVYKETKYNTVRAVQTLTAHLAELKNALPGYELNIIENQAGFIETAIDEVQETALYGIILAVIILFVFLRRLGTTFIISVAIPISVVATFNLMYFNDLTLNIMTLGGLALGAGMLVDNAIVVMENIFRNLERGLSLREAAITGTAEVTGAITSSTITTIVVFLPIVYLHGAAGELFKDQAWTVAFSLISSLAVAILVIPMLALHFLKITPSKKVDRSVQFLWYPLLLARILHHRLLIIACTIALVIFSFILLPLIGSEFIPKSEVNSFKIELALAQGTSIRHSDRVTAQFEDMIMTSVGSEIKMLYSRVGPVTESMSEQVESFFEDENTAIIHVYLLEERKKSADQIIGALDRIFKTIPDLKIRFIKELSSLQATLGTDQAPVMVEIKGDDLKTLQSLAESVKLRLASIEDIFNIETSFDEGRPEINILINRLRAGSRNLDLNTIISQLRDYLQGRLSGEWESGGEMRDITLRLPDVDVKSLSKIYINNGNEEVRLDEVAELKETAAQREINRRNQTRIGRVTAQIKGELALDHITSRIVEEIDQIPFPIGYQYQISGEEKMRAESFKNLKFALVLSIILIYMVMASQFESLIHPFTVLLTLPLAGVGAILIFFILDIPLNVMAYIGIIMLMGIAVNDSIILVDAINQLKHQGLALTDAILEAGQRRIRPIIMTSLTTILALIPLTIGFGESASLRAPMALAVIGGLFSSTLLTLVVIPCLYYVFEGISLKLRSPSAKRNI
jgi:HAE1 family hydrophobic/amphiphilic exporter-1